MQDSYLIKQDLSYLDYVNLTLYMLARNKMVKRLVIFIFCIGILAAVLSLMAPGPNEVVYWFSILKQMFGPAIVVILFFVVCVMIGGIFMVNFKSDVLKGV